MHRCEGGNTDVRGVGRMQLGKFMIREVPSSSVSLGWLELLPANLFTSALLLPIAELELLMHALAVRFPSLTTQLPALVLLILSELVLFMLSSLILLMLSAFTLLISSTGLTMLVSCSWYSEPDRCC